MDNARVLREGVPLRGLLTPRHSRCAWIPEFDLLLFNSERNPLKPWLARKGRK